MRLVAAWCGDAASLAAPGSHQPHSPHFSSTIHNQSAPRINAIPVLHQMKPEL